MLTRRQFVRQALKTSSLFAAGSVVPTFIARTAAAAQPGGDRVLVVIELTGGNDGLNTVIPYGDDLYHKARPTLRYEKKDVVRVDDHFGLNPGLSGLSGILERGHLALDHQNPALRREPRLLRGILKHRDHHLIEKAGRADHEVEMPEGHRVERPGDQGDPLPFL